MDQTRQNLLRVSDVLGEIKRQISSLERQAKKAARFKRLRETQRLLELSTSHDERAQLLESIESERRRSEELSDALSGREAQLGEKEAALENHRLELEERERTVMTESERLFHLRSQIKELEGALASLPDAQRQAVTLIHVEGLSVAEAAERAGVSKTALKVRAHRGYRAMHARLTEDDS